MKVKTILCTVICVASISGCDQSATHESKKIKSIKTSSTSMWLLIDPETKCEYITAYEGGLTSRMTADGKHKGCEI